MSGPSPSFGAGNLLASTALYFDLVFLGMIHPPTVLPYRKEESAACQRRGPAFGDQPSRAYWGLPLQPSAHNLMRRAVELS